MLPYMILTLLGIIVLVLAGVGACVYLFFNPDTLVAGIIASVTTLIFGSIMMYLWSVVQRGKHNFKIIIRNLKIIKGIFTIEFPKDKK